MRVLIIGENNYTKLKVFWKYYPILKKFVNINKAEIYSSDLKDSDFNCNWNYRVSILNAFLEQKFDIIIANNILEHLYNLEPFFKGVRYHLNKNGLFILRTDNALYLPYYIPISSKFLARLLGIGYHSSNVSKELWNENHYFIFTKKHLTNLIEKFGFKIVYCKYGIWKYGIKELNIPLAPRILIIAKPK
jgi:2-polyprenyl-3-methyl-5-hydroxy-6-metoxy-1,4-benzoquinol methylase